MNCSNELASDDGGQGEQMDEVPACPQSIEEARLTPRELQVLRLIAVGKPNKEIAVALGISVKTVETHVTRIFRKLGIQNRSETVAWALRHKLLFLGMLMSFAALYLGLQVFYQPYRVFPPPAHPFNLNAFQAWQSSRFGPFPLLAPLVCCLGGVDSLIVDRRDGFARAVLLRAPYRVYIMSKIAATAMVGALAIAFPMTAFFGYLCLTHPAALPPLEQFGVFENLPPGQIGGLLGTIFYSHPFAYVSLSIALASAFGAVYAVLGLSMAAYTDNRYIATAAPFVIFVCGIVTLGAILQIPRWPPIVPLVVTAVQQPT